MNIPPPITGDGVTDDANAIQLALLQTLPEFALAAGRKYGRIFTGAGNPSGTTGAIGWNTPSGAVPGFWRSGCRLEYDVLENGKRRDAAAGDNAVNVGNKPIMMTLLSVKWTR